MRAPRLIGLTFCMVAMLAMFAGIATADPWTAATVDVPADLNAERPVITSITAGGHTFPASELAFGVSNGNTGTYDGGACGGEGSNCGVGADPYPPLNEDGTENVVDDLILYLEFYGTGGWTTDYTGLPDGGYLDKNGDLHDFFLGESNGNDSIDVFATYSLDGGDTTQEGQALAFSSGVSPHDPSLANTMCKRSRPDI